MCLNILLAIPMNHHYRMVTSGLKSFANEKRIGSKDASSVKDVAQMVKKMPQYQKELNAYATHMHLAEDCMRDYQAKIANLCKVEQVRICSSSVSTMTPSLAL